MKILLPFIAIIACLFFAFAAPVIATQDAVHTIRAERQHKAAMMPPGTPCIAGQYEVIA